MDTVKLTRLWTKGKPHDRNVYRGSLLADLFPRSRLPVVGQYFHFAREDGNILRTSKVTDVQLCPDEGGFAYVAYVFTTQNSKYRLEIFNG